MNGRRAAILLSVLLLVGVLPLRAAFFMRWRGSDAALLEQLGGRTLYRTTARVNGAPARLQVLEFDRDAAQLSGDLARVWQLPAGGAAEGAWVTRVRDGRRVQLLLLPGAESGRCMGWLIEQRLSDLPAPEALPAPPTRFPHPAARVTFWAVNDRTRSLLAVGETDDAPAAALTILEAELAGGGWTPLLPTQPGRLVLYARSGRCCLVMLSPGTDPGRTRIAVLQQGGDSL